MRASLAELYESRNLFRLLAGNAHTTLAYTHNRLVQILLNPFREDLDVLIEPRAFYLQNDAFFDRVFANDPNIAYHSEYSLLSFRDKYRPGSLLLSLASKRRRDRVEQALDKEFASLYPRKVPWHDDRLRALWL